MPIDELELNLCIERFSTASPTAEGLTVQVIERDGQVWVQEIGGNGYVVYEFQIVDGVRTDSATDVVTLLERLHELEERCGAMAGKAAKPIDFPIWKQNRKRARRRLRRWLAEHPAAVVQAPEHLSYLIPTLPLWDDEEVYEFDGDELLERFYDEDEIGMFYDYTCRRIRSPVVVAPDLPPALRTLLEEARETFCRGLFRAAIAICRAVVEDCLLRKYDTLARDGQVVPVTDDSIKCVASALDKSTLPDKLRGFAFRIADLGNRAMHDAAFEVQEVDAWGVLVQTCVLVRFLSGGGYQVLPRNG